jgi:hypothetical protein
MNLFFVISCLVSCIVSRCDAFVVVPTHGKTNTVIRNAIQQSTTLLYSSSFPKQQQQQEHQYTSSNHSKINNDNKNIMKLVNTQMIAVSALIIANILPLSVIAAVVDDDVYEYGKVDAPIGLAIGVGLLTTLTAFLPLALKGGEEAFEEMRERDSTTFGKKSNKDVLKGGGKK